MAINVKQYTRRTKSGKTIRVRAYQKKGDVDMKTIRRAAKDENKTLRNVAIGLGLAGAIGTGVLGAKLLRGKGTSAVRKVASAASDVRPTTSTVIPPISSKTSEIQDEVINLVNAAKQKADDVVPPQVPIVDKIALNREKIQKRRELIDQEFYKLTSAKEKKAFGNMTPDKEALGAYYRLRGALPDFKRIRNAGEMQDKLDDIYNKRKYFTQAVSKSTSKAERRAKSRLTKRLTNKAMKSNNIERANWNMEISTMADFSI